MSLLVFYSKRFRSSRWKTAAHVFIKKFDFVCVCSPFFAQVCVAMPVCEENGGQCSVSSSIGPHLIFWDTGAHRLAGLTGQDSFRVLLPQTDSSGITGVCPCSWLFFFSHWDSSSGPHACPLSASPLGHLSIPVFVPVTQFSTYDITCYVDTLYCADSEFRVILYVCK